VFPYWVRAHARFHVFMAHVGLGSQEGGIA